MVIADLAFILLSHYKLYTEIIIFVKACDRNIKSTLQLAEEMLKLANKGDIEREDKGCGILYGILRDSAYKLRQIAETEMKKHIKKGWWKEGQP